MKCEVIGFRIDPKIKKQLKKLAKRKKRSLSDLSRGLLFSGIAEKQPNILTPNPKQ